MTTPRPLHEIELASLVRAYEACPVRERRGPLARRIHDAIVRVLCTHGVVRLDGVIYRPDGDDSFTRSVEGRVYVRPEVSRQVELQGSQGRRVIRSHGRSNVTGDHDGY